MTGLGCARSKRLMAARAAGLSEAEGMALERHLTQCGACRDDAAALEALARLSDRAADAAPGRPAWDRAIARSLATAAQPSEQAARGAPVRPGWITLGVGTLLGAAAAVVFMLGRPTPNRPPLTSTGASRAAASDRLAGGDLRVGGQPVDANTSLPAGVLLSSEHGATLLLGRAQVRLAAGGAVVWRPEAERVELAAGGLDADVVHDQTRRFRFATPGFVVEVLGTALHVDLAGARVQNGVVRIVDPAGNQLVAALRTGESWSAPAEAPASEQGSEAGDGAGKQKRVRRADIAQALALARRLLANGNPSEAERGLTRSLSEGHPDRAQAAEAGNLLAECALGAGLEAQAARRYLDVAQRYADLPAGEVALYAAATLEASSGDLAAARRDLARYLGAYPTGHFRKQAADRLAALGGAIR